MSQISNSAKEVTSELDKLEKQVERQQQELQRARSILRRGVVGAVWSFRYLIAVVSFMSVGVASVVVSLLFALEGAIPSTVRNATGRVLSEAALNWGMEFFSNLGTEFLVAGFILGFARFVVRIEGD